MNPKKLDLSGIDKTKEIMPQVEQAIKDQLGISLENMKSFLSAYIQTNGDQLAKEVLRIAPYDKYDTLLETDADKAEFLKNEAAKPENWELQSFGSSTTVPGQDMYEFQFGNIAVDEGQTLIGHVFIGGGKVKHAFAQMAD